jgi:hypothetical protein
MRLWTLHPKYLDSKGLVALWREGLLAQAVLSGQTKGYKHHPQLIRFIQTSDPTQYLSAYLIDVFAESIRRGLKFDQSKIGPNANVSQLTVTKGQLEYEWLHLTTKLKARAPSWLAQISGVNVPESHPLFRVIEGDIAPWEIVQA